MNDHNLDDLIIDNIEPKSSKTKSFLTIVALLIVVLIVGIILTKILLKNPNDNKLAFEQNAIEMIAPELKLEEIVKSPEVKKETSLSTIIESEIKAPLAETKKPEIKLHEAPEVVKSKKETSLSNITEQEIKSSVVETKKSVTVKEPKIVIEEEKAEEPVIKETVKIIKSIEPKKVKASKPVPKPIKKPVVTTHIPATVSTKSYYVQVGSFKNAPSTRFISVIKNTGFNHKVTKPDVDGTKKLLIGPYKDRASVDRALVQVRDRINKRAFVVKR